MTSNKAEYRLLEKNFLGGVLIPAGTEFSTSPRRTPSFTWQPLNDVAKEAYAKMVESFTVEHDKNMQAKKDGVDKTYNVPIPSHVSKIINSVVKPKIEKYDIHLKLEEEEEMQPTFDASELDFFNNKGTTNVSGKPRTKV